MQQLDTNVPVRCKKYDIGSLRKLEAPGFTPPLPRIAGVALNGTFPMPNQIGIALNTLGTCRGPKRRRAGWAVALLASTALVAVPMAFAPLGFGAVALAKGGVGGEGAAGGTSSTTGTGSAGGDATGTAGGGGGDRD